MGSSALGAATLVAHQGGWDEILMVLTPIALFAALLWLANSRATRLQQQRSTSADETPAPDADPPGAGPPDADPPEADVPPEPPGPREPPTPR